MKITTLINAGFGLVSMLAAVYVGMFIPFNHTKYADPAWSAEQIESTSDIETLRGKTKAIVAAFSRSQARSEAVLWCLAVINAGGCLVVALNQRVLRTRERAKNGPSGTTGLSC